MKKLAVDLKSVNKDIQALSKKLEKIMKTVADIKAKTKTTPKKKAAKKAKTAPKKKAAKKAKAVPAKTTTRKRVAKKKASAPVAAAVKKVVKKGVKKSAAPDTPTSKVLALMKRYKQGIAISTIKERSGLNDKQISNILHRASKEGKIKRVARGVYQLA